MKSVHLTRQADIIPAEVLGEPITIIGAGAIGGWTALGLAKMGFSNILVQDFDRVDEENINSQFYRMADIGALKVVALKHLVRDFTDTEISINETPYMGGVFKGIVISAVDNMKVRKLIFDQHKASPWFTKALIDPRMGAEEALLYSVRPGNVKEATNYAKSFYSDEEAVQERCTAKATMYTASLLSGLVCKAVKDILTTKQSLKTVQWNIAANDAVLFSREAG